MFKYVVRKTFSVLITFHMRDRDDVIALSSMDQFFSHVDLRAISLSLSLMYSNVPDNFFITTVVFTVTSNLEAL
jgi:hypothetical protein